MHLNPNTPLAVIGLGYVGLPLAVEFAKKRRVIGFDINAARIAELEAGRDSTLEVEPDQLQAVIDLASRSGVPPEALRPAVGQNPGTSPESWTSAEEGAAPATTGLSFTADPEALRACTCFIVTVPTPIDAHKRPDLTPLIKASETVGRVLKPGDIVIYESTVYPGCTEEDCVPILQRESGLKYITSSYPSPSLRGAVGDAAVQTPPGSPPAFGLRDDDGGVSGPRDDGSSSSLRGGAAHAPSSLRGAAAQAPSSLRGGAAHAPSSLRGAAGDVAIHAQGFYVGYSPERINPGDKAHRVTNINKVTSGSTPEIAETVDALYREIITAGTHKAESIRVAEAAKVIENTQRDLNIALMNELSVLFARLGIDTEAVLKAAGTNWRVSSLVEKTYKNEVATLQNGSVGRLQTCPITAEDALGAAAGYLAGSAKWYTWKTEEALKRHRAFKELGVESFRSKAARALRDEWLERKSVGFIHQAARYRGKANYREALFLAYGSGTEKILSGYLEDMHAVLRAFLAMAGAFACRRLGKALWSEFVADVDLKKAFTTRPGDVWA